MPQDSSSVLDDEVFILLLFICLVEIVQVLDEDALELNDVYITAVVWLTTFLIEYALIVYIGNNVGICNGLGLGEIGDITGNPVHIGQPAKNDALVICPGSLTIIPAGLAID